MGTQGVQGACMNETWELTEEGDTPNHYNNKEDIIRSLKTKSVLNNSDIEFEQENMPAEEMLLETLKMDNTLSSLESLEDMEESLVSRRQVASIKSKCISDLYAQNAGDKDIAEFNGKIEAPPLTFACNWNDSDGFRDSKYFEGISCELSMSL